MLVLKQNFYADLIKIELIIYLKNENLFQEISLFLPKH